MSRVIIGGTGGRRNVSPTVSYAGATTVQFLARDSIYAIARYMLSPVRLSVRPTHGWISQRRLKLGSRNLHHK